MRKIPKFVIVGMIALLAFLPAVALAPTVNISAGGSYETWWSDIPEDGDIVWSVETDGGVVDVQFIHNSQVYGSYQCTSCSGKSFYVPASGKWTMRMINDNSYDVAVTYTAQYQTSGGGGDDTGTGDTTGGTSPIDLSWLWIVIVLLIILGVIVAIGAALGAQKKAQPPQYPPPISPSEAPQQPPQTFTQPIQPESSVVKAAKELGIDTTGKTEEELRKEIARRMI